jgi:membrane associated rhomboid family serine protease
MSEEHPAPSAPPDKQPIINAPLIVIVMTLLLLALHAAYEFAPLTDRIAITYDFALAPERFWAPAGSPSVYPDAPSGLLTLLSSALLHADWLHVIVNSMMLLALGAPVARALGSGVRGAALFMLLFVVSVIGGSALYLAFSDVNSAYAVGASGGTSGLFAAVFLLNPDGGKHALWSRRFLGMTLAFALVNVLLVIAGPYLLGAFVAWQAHAGGYIAGALLMALLPIRGRDWARS